MIRKGYASSHRCQGGYPGVSCARHRKDIGKLWNHSSGEKKCGGGWGIERKDHMEEEKQKRCQFCGELILAIARKCKHCGEFLDGLQGREIAPAPSESDKPEPEKTVWTGTPSLLCYLPAYVAGVILPVAVLLIAIIAIGSTGGSFVLIPILVVGIGGGLSIIWWAQLDRKNTVFTVTSRRVMAKRGIISKSTQEVTMKDIRTINFTQGILERIFSLGTVQICSAGTGDIDVQFAGIPNAQRVKDIISRYKEKG